MPIDIHEISASIGGFSDQEILEMPVREYKERDNLSVPIGLFRHTEEASRVFNELSDRIGDPNNSGYRSIIYDEAPTNVVFHGGLAQNPGLRSLALLSIEVDQGETRRKLTYVLKITDHTPLFDTALIPDPTDGENASRAGGRGLFMIRAFGNATIEQVSHTDPAFGQKSVVITWQEEFEISASE